MDNDDENNNYNYDDIPDGEKKANYDKDANNVENNDNDDDDKHNNY